MPYREGSRLPGERASRLGHLEVLKSDLVRQLCERFEDNIVDEPSTSPIWEPLPTGGKPLPIVFGVDGSMQVVTSEIPPHMALAFVKTALLAVDQYALSRLDKDAPHPFALRDILSRSAQYHSTVFPLRHVSVPGMRNYDAIRQIVFDSRKDPSLEGEPLETLKWLIYEKWSERGRELAPFQCPHCEQEVAVLPYNADEGTSRLQMYSGSTPLFKAFTDTGIARWLLGVSPCSGEHVFGGQDPVAHTFERVDYLLPLLAPPNQFFEPF